MKKLSLALLLMSLVSPVMAEECNKDFGPWDENGCGPNVAVPLPGERIPIDGWDYPVGVSIKQPDGTSVYVSVPVTVQVVDDFVFMFATLPNGVKVSGVSNQCIQSFCPYLGNFARMDMEYKLDAVLRFDTK